MTGLLRKIPGGLLTVATWALIVYLTVFYTPSPEVGKSLFKHADKVVHALMFGFVAWIEAIDLLVRRPCCNPRIDRAIIMCAALMAVAGGGLIEILQSHTLTRSAEWADFVADIAGVLLSLPLTFFCCRLLRNSDVRHE